MGHSLSCEFLGVLVALCLSRAVSQQVAFDCFILDVSNVAVTTVYSLPSLMFCCRLFIAFAVGAAVGITVSRSSSAAGVVAFVTWRTLRLVSTLRGFRCAGCSSAPSSAPSSYAFVGECTSSRRSHERSSDGERTAARLASSRSPRGRSRGILRSHFSRRVLAPS